MDGIVTQTVLPLDEDVDEMKYIVPGNIMDSLLNT